MTVIQRILIEAGVVENEKSFDHEWRDLNNRLSDRQSYLLEKKLKEKAPAIAEETVR